MVGVEQEDRPASEELARLRAAAAAVADLDGAPADAGPDGEAHGDGTLGDGSLGDGTLGDGTLGDHAGFDAAVHADRFAELHDALVTVLADVDRG